MLITYRVPSRGKDVGYKTFWNYATSISDTPRQDALHDFIVRKNSGWLDYDIVDLKSDRE